MKPSLHCAFVIDKPVGESSTHYVQAVRRRLSSEWNIPFREITIGHGGTLDPFASGVLVVLCGFATRLSEIYLKGDKEYLATARLGTKTTTADNTGEALQVDESGAAPLSLSDWQQLADQFLKSPYLQTPPQYSSKKVDGVAAYVHARAGQEVKLQPKLQKIHRLQILSATSEELVFSVTCASGTYVRTLAEDLAERGGKLAHLTALRRTKKAEFTLQEAASMEALRLHQDQVPFHHLGRDLLVKEMSKRQVQGIFLGDQKVIAESISNLGLTGSAPSSEYALLKHQGQTVALAHFSNGHWNFQRAFPLAFDMDLPT